MSLREMRFAAVRPYLAAGCSLVALVAMVLPSAPARIVGVMIFVTFGPGLAVIRWFGAGDYRDLVLIVSFSLALHLVLAVAMTYAGLWTPHGLLSLAACAVLLLSAVEIAQTRRDRAAAPTAHGEAE
jgi:hypothetical protein